MKNEKRAGHADFEGGPMYNGSKREPYVKAIANIVIGVFFATAGILEFFQIQKWEINGGHISMNEGTALLYKLIGKWGILVFMGILGLVFIRKGVLQYRQIKRLQKADF